MDNYFNPVCFSCFVLQRLGAAIVHVTKPFSNSMFSLIFFSPQALCGHPVLESFTRHKDRAFVVSSEYPTVGDNGLEIDGAWFREGSRDRKNSSGFEGKSVAFNNMDDLMSKKFHKSQQRHMISAS